MKGHLHIRVLALVVLSLIGGQWLPVKAQGGSLNMTLQGTWADPAVPVTSQNTRYNDVWGYAKAGREYALLGASNGVHVIDITVPSMPSRVQFISILPANTVWRDVEVYQDYMYVVTDQGADAGLEVYYLGSLPGSCPKVYDSQAHFGTCHTIAIDQGSGRLYASGTTTQAPGVVILDIATNPASPALLASFNLGGYVHDLVSLRDTVYAFFATGGAVGGFDFADLNNPSALGMIYSYPEIGYAHSGAVTDDMDYLYFCTETHNTGVHIADIKDPFNIIHQSTFRSTLLAPAHTNSTGHNPFIKGNLLFVSYYQDGVQVWDISDPLNPARVAYYDTHPQSTNYTGWHGAWSVYPYLPSGNILVSDTDNGLYIVRSTISLPVTLENLAARRDEEGVKVTWQTRSEQNNTGFEVERSEDGTAFTKIGWVPGQLNSREVQHYAFPDEAPLSGRSYYRLKQIDVGGNASYSEIVSVQEAQAVGITSLAPSPVKSGEDIEVILSVDSDAPVRLTATNSLGQVVWEGQVQSQDGQASFTLPTQGLADGAYLFKAASKSQVVTRRFVVVGQG